MRKTFVAVVLMGGLIVGTADRSLASHEHWLDTPGTCVADIASGQTAQGPGEGGYHQFHENVHLGTPGTEAFANPHNPVEVGKGSCS